MRTPRGNPTANGQSGGRQTAGRKGYTVPIKATSPSRSLDTGHSFKVRWLPSLRTDLPRLGKHKNEPIKRQLLFAHAVFTSCRREFSMSLLDTLQRPPTRVCNSSRIHERDEQRHRKHQ